MNQIQTLSTTKISKQSRRGANLRLSLHAASQRGPLAPLSSCCMPKGDPSPSWLAHVMREYQKNMAKYIKLDLIQIWVQFESNSNLIQTKFKKATDPNPIRILV